MKTNIVFKNPEYLESFVEKLAQRAGKYISYANPILDGTLSDGSRVNATYTKDITSRGPTFCFKDGNIQLNDGRVKNIKDFFNECKTNFGSKIEAGDEIVEVLNTQCCGVDEKNLEQKDSLIKTVIKLKSPEKLVKITFSDGGEIEITLNHLFHVVDENLKLLEAKDLTEGMIVPMPKKLNISGCRQKINVYSLIKDFSYAHKVCIVNNQPIKEIVSQEIQSGGKNFRQVLSQKYKVGNSYFYEIINRGNSISFEVLNQICQVKNIDFNNFTNISLNVYGGGTKNKSKAVKIPSEIDEELSYIVGALISDGHISKANIDFSCYEEGFKNSLKEKLLNKFGKFESYYDDNRIYLCNLFIPFFFNKVFGIPMGKKYNIVKIPEVIFKSDNKTIASFIRGLFDGDGTVSSGLSYKTYSKDLAEGLTYLLARLGIYSYLRNKGREFRVNIPSPDYKKYLEIIGFDCKPKQEGLKKLIEKQIDETKVNINHNRIPAKPFLQIIKKIGIFRKDLFEGCNISYNRLNQITFSRDFAKKILCEIEKYEKTGQFKEEIEYIKWMLNSNQEFVKISKVEIIENNEPVYDIELEPCKFFIAGNKPMNLFDTIRKFTKKPWTPVQLIALNTLSPEMLAYLWLLIEYKMNILITGGTASGKTTMLNAIAFFIPPEERVVSIEDTREINLPRDNWLPSVIRDAIGLEKTGEIDLFTLLKSSFRQNPDYVIVGEVRGKEASVLFQGMASGHASISTIHADSVDTVIKRLETPPIELSPTLLNVLDCVCIMTHAIVNKQETRKLKAIVEIVNVTPDGVALTNTPFIWNPQDDQFYFKRNSKIFEKIVERYGIRMEEIYTEFRKRVQLLYNLFSMKIFKFEQVQEIINEYYKKPEETLRKFGVIQ